MKDLDQILEILEQKKTFFLLYEKEMEALPLLATEELEPCVLRGAKIIEKIEELEAKLKRLIKQNGSLAISVVNHTCDRGQLTPELWLIYDASLAVKAVASRILQNNAMILQRIEMEKTKALENIKGLNSKSSSVAGKYQRSAQAGVRSSFRDAMEREI